jgi:hypothetical protein
VTFQENEGPQDLEELERREQVEYDHGDKSQDIGPEIAGIQTRECLCVKTDFFVVTRLHV